MDLQQLPGRGRLEGKIALVIGGGSIGEGWGNGKAAAFVYARVSGFRFTFGCAASPSGPGRAMTLQ